MKVPINPDPVLRTLKALGFNDNMEVGGGVGEQAVKALKDACPLCVGEDRDPLVSWRMTQAFRQGGFAPKGRNRLEDVDLEAAFNLFLALKPVPPAPPEDAEPVDPDKKPELTQVCESLLV